MTLLYIDPGTGSMLFSIFIGIAAAGIYFLRGLFIKLKTRLTGGNVKKDDEKHQYVIFSDSKRYWNVFRPICDELEASKLPAEYWTCSPDDPALEMPYQHVKCSFIGEGNKAFVKLNMMKANIVLTTTPGLDVLQWKRSRNVDCYMHILHAIGSAAAYRMFEIDYFDVMLLSGEFQGKEVRKLEEIRGLTPKEIIYVGQPYLDEMLKRKQASDSNKAKKDEARTVLLAPSWGSSSIFSRFGGSILEALKATGYNIIVRPHPQSFTADKDIIEPLMREYPESEKFSWNRDNDNFDVLDRADVMITDFSGVIYDYTLVFDKPIIYADVSFDHAPYDSAWLEEPMWKFEIIPKLGRELQEKDFPHMKELIDDVIKNEQYAKGRDQARKEAWMYPGESAKRTVDCMVQKMQEIKERQEEKDKKQEK